MSAIFSSVITLNITFLSFMVCTITSILIGAGIAITYMKTSKRYTNSFVTTLAILPAVVQIVIMMVNGNVGAGVAVAGAFSLVRFRSLRITAAPVGSPVMFPLGCPSMTTDCCIMSSSSFCIWSYPTTRPMAIFLSNGSNLLFFGLFTF